MSEAPLTPAESAVADAARFLAERAGPAPDVALVLGSGFGGLADELESVSEVAYRDIPGFPVPTVEGHRGVVRAGRLGNCRCAVFAGRFHLYEGHAADTVALPVRAAIRWGARWLIVTNAAGGINRTFRPGDLMLIDDHINLMWSNPLIGPGRRHEVRFPDMSAPYDPALMALAERVAAAEEIRLVRGVYCGLSGPSYETAAEIRMLERMGADAVGMSTIPEVLVARAAGVRVLGLSLITNPATGLAARPLSHDEVMAVGLEAGAASTRLLRGVLAEPLPA